MNLDGMTEDGLPFAAVNFGRTSFPFRMRVLDKETREVLWEHVVHFPEAVHVPGFAPRVVLAEVTFANGQQLIDGPDVHEEHLLTPPPRF